MQKIFIFPLTPNQVGSSLSNTMTSIIKPGQKFIANWDDEDFHVKIVGPHKVLANVFRCKVIKRPSWNYIAMFGVKVNSIVAIHKKYFKESL